MSEKKKTSSTKKTATKKSTTTKKSTSKKSAAKTTTTKKSTTKKPATTAKKSTKSKPKSSAPKKTTTTKTTTQTKSKVVRAKILSYRRDNRLQNTNQAIAELLDDYNHKALLGKKFVLVYSNSDTIAKGKVIAIHGQLRSKRVRITFDNSGVTAHAINEIIEIQV